MQAMLLSASFVALIAVVAAAAAHWALRRVGRRLPLWLARGSGKPLPSGAPPPWEAGIELVLLILKVSVWLAAAACASEQFAALRQVRAMLVRVVVMSVTSQMFVLNGHAYSSLDLLELPLVLAALWIATSGLTRFLKVRILSSTRMERGLQDAVAMLLRYALAFLGAIVVLQVWGIDASSLTFVASVLGVGIGFGLQHLANNFVSGLVVSIERPIQPGDFVKVGEWMGTVERIGPRNTEIRTLDSVSILVPNSRFLETEVVNWTHGDPVSRLHIPVGVAYGSDITRVRAALLDAAVNHPEVLSDPRPRVELHNFGDSALHFELLVWTRDPRTQFRLTSDLNYRIEANLRRYGIEIPFPQRDLRLRSPQLEQVLLAWSRRHFTESELGAPNGADKVPQLAGVDASQGFEDDLAPRNWTDEELDGLAGRMRSPAGISIVDRRHLLTVYPKCFVGREAVDWMTRALNLTRKESVDLGQLLMQRGVVHHVLDEHGFEDANLFYRFRADEVEEHANDSLHLPA